MEEEITQKLAELEEASDVFADNSEMGTLCIAIYWLGYSLNTVHGPHIEILNDLGILKPAEIRD